MNIGQLEITRTYCLDNPQYRIRIDSITIDLSEEEAVKICKELGVLLSLEDDKKLDEKSDVILLIDDLRNHPERLNTQKLMEVIGRIPIFLSEEGVWWGEVLSAIADLINEEVQEDTNACGNQSQHSPRH